MTPVRRPRPQQPKSSRCGPSGGRPLPTKQRRLYLLPAVGNQVVKVRSATWAAKKIRRNVIFKKSLQVLVEETEFFG